MSDPDLLPNLAPPPGGLDALRARIAPAPRLGRGWLLAGSALALAAVMLLLVLTPPSPTFSPDEMLAVLDASGATVQIQQATVETVLETDQIVLIRWKPGPQETP